MPGAGLFDSSDDDTFVVGPTLDQRVIDGVMAGIRTERVNWEAYLQEIMNNDREKADKKLQKMMNIIVMLAMAMLVMTIALVVVGYVVYTMPVKIVINVPNAATGQCPVVDDWMHDFNAFEEPPAGETLETEHHMFQDLFQQASVLGVSVIKSKHFATFLGAGGPLAVGGAVFTTVFLTFIGY
jgi:hypothetical protein